MMSGPMACSRRTRWLLGAAIALAGGCGGSEGAPARDAPARPGSAIAPKESAPASPPVSASAAASAAPEIDPEPPGAADTTPEDAERVLFLATHLRTTELRQACPESMKRAPRIRCLIELRYADVPASKELALTLYSETGSLAGLLPEEWSDDGRGSKIHLTPARPIGDNREHLRWILDAFRDYAKFEADLAKTAPIAFQDRPVHFRFFVTDKGGNPSAFAVSRNIGYNLYGSVNVSDSTVRDTLFHEIFHLNDSRLGDWSAGALGPILQGILAKCGGRSACLAPYAPTDTMIQGSYYAFVKQSGAREYAAEVGLRFYREHRYVREGKPLPLAPFKCGPAENREAWNLVRDRLFGGVDRVPACGPP